MAGYIIEFRDESGYEEVMEKLHKAKKAIKEVCEAMEDGGSEYEERRGGGNYRRGMAHRGGYGHGPVGYRDEYDDNGSMSAHQGRGRYDYE